MKENFWYQYARMNAAFVFESKREKVKNCEGGWRHR